MLGSLDGSYRRFRKTYRYYLKESSTSSLKMGPIDCPETSVANYQSTLRNSPPPQKKTNILFTPQQENKITHGFIVSLILKLSSRGEWSAARPGLFTPTERSPVPIKYRRLCKPQRRFERFGEQSLDSVANRTADCPAHSLITLPITLSRCVISRAGFGDGCVRWIQIARESVFFYTYNSEVR